MDNLVTCNRCGGNACYEQKVNEEVTTYLCMGCGFTTATNMTENSAPVRAALESAPDLYKALKFEDKNKNIWFPATITLPNKGMVFVDGTSKDNWKWASVKSILITEEEKEKFPKGQTHKMDMHGIQHHEQKDFMNALEQIGFFSIQ